MQYDDIGKLNSGLYQYLSSNTEVTVTTHEVCENSSKILSYFQTNILLPILISGSTKGT